MTCPCKQKFTDAEKDLINGQNGKTFIQNPNGAVAGNTISGLNSAAQTAGSIITLLGGTGDRAQALKAAGVNVGALQGLVTNMNSLGTTVTAFKNQADFLSNPQNLMASLGTLSFAANLGCALGIEGLDVGVSVNVLGDKGGSAVNVAFNVQANLNTLLGGMLNNPVGEQLNSVASQFNSSLGSITSQINEGLNSIKQVTDDSVNTLSKATSLVTNFSQINYFKNLLGDASDPCNKVSVALANDNILTPEFKQLASAANASTSTGGSSR